MNERDLFPGSGAPVDFVREQKRVALLLTDGTVRFRGRVRAYYDAPTFAVELDDGRMKPWLTRLTRADQSTPPPAAGGTTSRGAALREAPDDSGDDMIVAVRAAAGVDLATLADRIDQAVLLATDAADRLRDVGLRPEGAGVDRDMPSYTTTPAPRGEGETERADARDARVWIRPGGELVVRDMDPVSGMGVEWLQFGDPAPAGAVPLVPAAPVPVDSDGSASGSTAWWKVVAEAWHEIAVQLHGGGLGPISHPPAPSLSVRRVLADRGWSAPDEPLPDLLVRVLDELGARSSDPYGTGDGSYSSGRREAGS